jgi:hypothetical protein
MSWKFLSRKYCIISFLSAVGSSEDMGIFEWKNTSGIIAISSPSYVQTLVTFYI